MIRALALGLALLTAGSTVVVHAQGQLPRVLAWVDTLYGTDEQPLRWPSAIAASSTGEVAVADAYEPKVMLFRRVGVSWQLVRTASLPAVPVGLTHDGRRFIATLRTAPHLIALEGPQLAVRRLSLPAGVVPGAVTALDGGELLLVDLTGSRILKLSAEGEILREAVTGRPISALAPLPAGGFLAAVGSEARLVRYDAAWNLQGEWDLPADGPEPAWPVAIVVEPGGDALVLDRHSGRILVVDASGGLLGIGSREGWEPGQLLYPAGMARLDDGAVVVADQGNGRAQVFRRTDRRGSP